LRDRERMDRIARVALYAVTGPAAVAFALREMLASGLRLVPGDAGDARLVVFVMEHWRQVLAGDAAWLSPPVFHPVEGVLGYSDALLLYGLAHAALAPFGLDAFASLQAVLVALAAVGFGATALLLRRRLGWPHAAAALGAALFVAANNLYLKGAHLQLYAVLLVPLAVWWLSGAALALRRRDRRALRRHGAGVALGVPALLYTSFYVGWLLLFFVALYLAVLAWRTPAARLRAWLADTARTYRREAVWLGGLGLLALLPFWVTHAPVALAFGSWRFRAVMKFAARPLDVANVGPGNLLWGPLVERYMLADGIVLHEVWTGFGLVTLSLFAASLFGLRRLSRTGERVEARERHVAAVRARSGLDLRVLGVTVLLVWALTLRVDGVSLWRLPYYALPGAGGIRALGRAQLVLTLPVLIVALDGLVRLARAARRGGRRHRVAGTALVGALGLALLAEQVNHQPVAGLDVVDARRTLAGFPAPPSECEVFYVTPPLPDARSDPALQLDAMRLAQRFGIPTLNGYSGQFPHGWRALYRLREPAYEQRVARWVAERGVTGRLCALELATRTWRTRGGGT